MAYAIYGERNYDTTTDTDTMVETRVKTPLHDGEQGGSWLIPRY
jgi:hypothetical protein